MNTYEKELINRIRKLLGNLEGAIDASDTLLQRSEDRVKHYVKSVAETESKNIQPKKSNVIQFVPRDVKKLRGELK